MCIIPNHSRLRLFMILGFCVYGFLVPRTSQFGESFCRAMYSALTLSGGIIQVIELIRRRA